MDDLTKDFLVESYENLDHMDRDFVELEKNPSNEILSNIFRAIHTIKGTCGFLGFAKLESVAHVGENLLSLLRDGVLQVNPAITDALLAMVDAVRQMLASIESAGSEGARDDSLLIETLSALQKDQVRATVAHTVTEMTDVMDIPPGARFGEILLRRGRVTREELNHALEQQTKGDPRSVGEILVQQGSIQPAEVLATLRAQSEIKAAVSDSTVRVDVRLLDKLMNLVGELVLARNQILQYADAGGDAFFLATTERLNLIITELQKAVMKTRMQPVSNIWNKFPRLVRDLAASCKKKTRLEMEGKETELDRTVIEAIKDPLTHILRNSIDHGIETPDRRVACGKPAEGRLLLRAFHEAGLVNIEIADDGCGINPETIRERACQRGFITAAQGARMSEREILDLIFVPGFSTVETVTNVSGRGVGMDVVKTNLERINGSVEVQSRWGEGTILKLKIPLTLAIIPALLVTVGGGRYAIPQISLLELVRLQGDQAQQGVEMVQGAPVYRLRGFLLPLVCLRREFRLPERSRDRDDNQVNIVVVQGDGRQFGLLVDRIGDSEDIVVRPLGKHFKGISAFSGATILGDGKIALILDVIGIFQAINVVSNAGVQAAFESQFPPIQMPSMQQGCLIRKTAKTNAFVSSYGSRNSRLRPWKGATVTTSCSIAARSCRCFAFSSLAVKPAPALG